MIHDLGIYLIILQGINGKRCVVWQTTHCFPFIPCNVCVWDWFGVRRISWVCRTSCAGRWGLGGWLVGPSNLGGSPTLQPADFSAQSAIANTHTHAYCAHTNKHTHTHTSARIHRYSKTQKNQLLCDAHSQTYIIHIFLYPLKWIPIVTSWFQTLAVMWILDRACFRRMWIPDNSFIRWSLEFARPLALWPCSGSMGWCGEQQERRKMSNIMRQWGKWSPYHSQTLTWIFYKHESHICKTWLRPESHWLRAKWSM